MDERKAPGYYGMRVGLISGLFSILQVLFAAAALNGARAAVSAYYTIGYPIGELAIINVNGSIPTLTDQIGGLLFKTVLSTVVMGVVTLVFAWYAGRLTATAIGRHKGGASAGSSVWWVSSLIWIVASLIGAAATSPGGNLIDIPTSFFSAVGGHGFNTNFFPLGFIALLVLDGLVALIGWGFCAAAGAMGASTAPRDANAMAFAPGMLAAPLGMPPMALAGYPPMPGYPQPQGYPPYPPHAFGPPAGVYPPPPGYYAPQQAGQTTPRPPTTTPTSLASGSDATAGDDRRP
jgi:hypothetical protein